MESSNPATGKFLTTVRLRVRGMRQDRDCAPFRHHNKSASMGQSSPIERSPRPEARSHILLGAATSFSGLRKQTSKLPWRGEVSGNSSRNRMPRPSRVLNPNVRLTHYRLSGNQVHSPKSQSHIVGVFGLGHRDVVLGRVCLSSRLGVLLNLYRLWGGL
jgi:hypothetical protein